MCKTCHSPVRLFRRLLAVFAASAVLTACQHLGPWAIEEGRERYNEKIHMTSRDQLFANMIRVANNESPLFMDVSADSDEVAQAIRDDLARRYEMISPTTGRSHAGA